MPGGGLACCRSWGRRRAGLSPLVETAAVGVPTVTRTSCSVRLLPAPQGAPWAGTPRLGEGSATSRPQADATRTSWEETGTHPRQPQNHIWASARKCVPGGHTSWHRAGPGHTLEQCDLHPRLAPVLAQPPGPEDTRGHAVSLGGKTSLRIKQNEIE